jgi:hypothetical protein
MPNEAKSMPEAEVALRLAFWLLDRADEKAHADIAVDGAHVLIKAHKQAGRQVEERTVFDIQSFLIENDCHAQNPKDNWRGSYIRKGRTFNIKSAQGFDVKVTCDGKDIKAECKGGPMQPVKGRSPAMILVSAIGQVIVSSSIEESDELWVAVPDSPAFEKAGVRTIKSRAFVNTGIKIALVGRNNVRLLS